MIAQMTPSRQMNINSNDRSSFSITPGERESFGIESNPLLNFELRDAQREIESLNIQLAALTKEMEQDKKDLKTMEFINDDLEKRLEAEARSRMVFQKSAQDEKNELYNKIKALEAERDIGRLKSIEERRLSESIGARLERTQKDLLAMHNRKYKLRAQEAKMKEEAAKKVSIIMPERGGERDVDDEEEEVLNKGRNNIEQRDRGNVSRTMKLTDKDNTPDNYVASQIRERLSTRESFISNLIDFYGFE